MADGFMVPGGVSISGDTFTARRLYINMEGGSEGSTWNAAKAGCLYVFSAYVVDGGHANLSFSGGHCLWSETAWAGRYFVGTFVEVWAADTDGSVSVSGGNCVLLELTPDA